MSDFINNYLDGADKNSIANVVHDQSISVRELERRTLNVGVLSEISSSIGSRVDTVGHVGLTKLNRLLLFNTQATPTIVLPPDALTGSNVLEIILTGQFYQNTGSTQTITPRFYIGKSGSETLVTSDTALSVGTGATRKGFVYTIRVSAAPQCGTKVQVDERFDLESPAVAGTNLTIMRTTRTTVIDISTLSDINSCFMRIANGATATMFRIYTNTLSVQVLDAVQASEIHWYSQPVGSDGIDTQIISDTPTTNYGSNTQIGMGDSNVAASKRRTLIKLNDLSNFIIDPDLIGFQISEAFLYLTLSTDQSSNTRTFELFRLLVDFDVTQATWNIRKTATNWGTAGGQAGVDYDSTPLANCSIAAAETIGVVKAFGFTAYGIAELQKIINGTYVNYGFIGIAQTEVDDNWAFHSADSATPELAPMLYLIGSVPN